jgi:hypothetical protein
VFQLWQVWPRKANCRSKAKTEAKPPTNTRYTITSQPQGEADKHVSFCSTFGSMPDHGDEEHDCHTRRCNVTLKGPNPPAAAISVYQPPKLQSSDRFHDFRYQFGTRWNIPQLEPIKPNLQQHIISSGRCEPFHCQYHLDYEPTRSFVFDGSQNVLISFVGNVVIWSLNFFSAEFDDQITIIENNSLLATQASSFHVLKPI